MVGIIAIKTGVVDRQIPCIEGAHINYYIYRVMVYPT